MTKNFENILSKQVQTYIAAHINSNIQDLALQRSPFPDIDFKSILQQIQSKKKSINKLPTWFATQNIIYPSTISIEQTSSETTAAYKASLISGDYLLDATGGFGVDAYFFSKKVKHVWHAEMNNELSEIVAHNFHQLHVDNVTCIQKNSTYFLQETDLMFDWIYIDPARRDSNQRKVFLLEDCEPNIVSLLDLYFSKSSNLLIKTAPLLDIQLGTKSLSNVKNIYIIAVNNEVKEILWHLEKDFNDVCQLHAININNEHITQFTGAINDDNYCNYSLPLKYLYEPNSAILKSGWFKKVANIHQISKLDINSHLYTSQELIQSFEILQVITYQKSNFKSFQKTQANISIRNFPLTVAQLKEKHQIHDGGTSYYFFTTDTNQQKILIIANKV